MVSTRNSAPSRCRVRVEPRWEPSRICGVCRIRPRSRVDRVDPARRRRARHDRPDHDRDPRRARDPLRLVLADDRSLPDKWRLLHRRPRKSRRQRRDLRRHRANDRLRAECRDLITPGSKNFRPSPCLSTHAKRGRGEGTKPRRQQRARRHRPPQNPLQQLPMHQCAAKVKPQRARGMDRTAPGDA